MWLEDVVASARHRATLPHSERLAEGRDADWTRAGEEAVRSLIGHQPGREQAHSVYVGRRTRDWLKIKTPIGQKREQERFEK
jgi:hypothetical protein